MHTVTLYADTLSYKTSELRRIAWWLFSRTGRPVRYIAADRSGLKIMSDMIQAGIVEALEIPRGASPMSLMNALSRGNWLPWLPTPPSNANGNKPGVRLVMPGESGTWNGITYNNDLGPGTSYMIEGYSTIAQAMLIHLVQNTKVKALTNAFSFTEESYDPTTPAGELVASAAMPHYGTVQNRILELTTSFAQLPGDYCFWTSHEAKGKDEFSGNLALGPRIVGKAATTTILPLLHDYFHIDIVPMLYQHPPAVQGGPPQMVEVLERHAYFERHPCRELPGNYWPATIRMAWEAFQGQGLSGAGPYQMIKQRWPQGFINLSRGESILDYLILREQALAHSTANLTAWADEVRRHFAGTGGVPPVTIEMPQGQIQQVQNHVITPSAAPQTTPQNFLLPGIPTARG